MCASVKEPRGWAEAGRGAWRPRPKPQIPPTSIDVEGECDCRACRHPNRGPNNLHEVENHIRTMYSIKKRIGKGAYGVVWKALCRRNEETVAIKKVFNAFVNVRDAQMTFREIMYLKEFGSHPNIIRLLNIHRAVNNKDIYLIFECMDIDLDHLIKKGNVLKEYHKRYITYQLLKAIKYIHSGYVIHRDLKPSNILLNTRCECKIADFGLARSLSRPSFSSTDGLVNPPLTDYVATRWYRPPEILLSTKKYTKGVDMWSMGCIVGEMLIGKVLFPGTSTSHQLELVMSTIPRPSCRDVEQSMSANLPPPSPPNRKSLKETLKGHPMDGIDLVRHLLVFNPLKRLSAQEALAHPFVELFRDRRKEVSLTHPVVPHLRDDVQLTVDEYRQAIYDSLDHLDCTSFRPEKPCYCSAKSSGKHLQPVETKRLPTTKMIPPTKHPTSGKPVIPHSAARPALNRGGSGDAWSYHDSNRIVNTMALRFKGKNIFLMES